MNLEPRLDRVLSLTYPFYLRIVAVIMATPSLCFNCNIHLQANRQSYVILDMSPEIVTTLEGWTTREVLNEDRLCEECFSLIITELNANPERPERQLGHHSLCIVCGISVARRSGRSSRSLPEGRPERTYIESLIFPRQILEDARACNACWQRAHYRVLNEPVIAENEPPILEADNEDMQEQEDNDREPNPDPENIGTVSLSSYSRSPDTPSHCFVPECMNAERRRVPLYLRRRILGEYKLFITSNSRVCEQHASMYNWDILREYEFMNVFTSTHLEEMLDILGNPDAGHINFENVESMNESLCHYWTGLTIINFLVLFNIIQAGFTNCKKKKTALGLYLVKLRTGESFARMASIFKITTYVVRAYTIKARNCLKSIYVPMYLGIGHISREALSMRNLLIPQGLFSTEENNPIVICDGTYIYLQKSSNYLFQKKTYSLHKYRNLVKPFLIVATDGHILDVFGPYPATTSDAEIMLQLFSPGADLRNYFRENDVFILDRGFRDAIGLLTSLGYLVYKPESRSENEGPQMSTIKANKSRLVTMCRWVVEVVNGRFKRDYKIFRANYFNRMSRNLMDDFRIAAALQNHFHPVITDRTDAGPILQRALERYDIPNYLADHVERHHLNRHRAHFVRIDGQIPQLDMFPVLEMSDLILISLGTYQIKQARSYYGEHIRTNGTFVVEVNDNLIPTIVPEVPPSVHERLLIRGRIKSRHHTNTVYFTYILLTPHEDDWRDQITQYYCSCIIGKRTVGTCAHVMTIIWYLGWARHQRNIISAPASFLDGILVREDE